MIGLGFLLVDVVLPFHGIGRADESVNDWLASHRSSGLDDASYVGSAVGDIPFIPALVILTALVTALLRKWRAFAFIVGAILVEVATYRVTSLIVHRQRPSVPRLDPDHLPVNQSYPSGHVAAAVVVYVGLALLLSAAGVRDRLRPRSRSGHSPSRCRSSSHSRGCTAACTTRSMRPPGVLMGVGRDRHRAGRHAGRGRSRAGALVTRVAVIAHRGKSVGGGLPELRRVLEQRGVTDVFWREVGKSRFAPDRGRGRRSPPRPISSSCGAATAWCSAASTPSRAARRRWPSCRPAPPTCWRRISASRRTSRPRWTSAWPGPRRRIDVGRINGERFAVMAGAGLDARMIGDADGGLKDRVGRLAYVWTGAKHLREKPFRAKITVDGARWFDGEASCILLGNVGKLFGGIEAFEDAHPDDGVLELGVVSADGVKRVGRHDRPRRGRHREQIPARLHDQGALRSRQARSQGAVRARRRRPQEGAQAAHRDRAGRP